jgi:hypothetical protein
MPRLLRSPYVSSDSTLRHAGAQCGNLLLHVARATDFQGKQAANTMALEELLSDAIYFLRVSAA